MWLMGQKLCPLAFILLALGNNLANSICGLPLEDSHGTFFLPGKENKPPLLTQRFVKWRVSTSLTFFTSSRAALRLKLALRQLVNV